MDIIKKVNNEVDFKNVQYERKIISRYGGGCSQKIGVSIWEKNGNLILILSLSSRTSALLIESVASDHECPIFDTRMLGSKFTWR